MKIWNIGYPRVGSRNEWRACVHSWESGKSTKESVLENGSRILRARWTAQHELGVDSIPLNDFSLWDPVLDTAWLFNLLPQKPEEGMDWVDAQASLTRTLAQVPWFRTGYLCYQPEWNGKVPLRLNREKLNWEIQNQKQVPFKFHVTILGPWTMASLTKLQGRTRSELLKELAPLYLELLREMKKKGFEWVVLEEPGFCLDLQKEDIKLIHGAYEQFKGQLPKLVISTYYDSPDPWLTEFSQLPVQGFHYDLVAGPAVLSWIKTRSFPKEKLLGLGLVSGTQIWAASVASLYKQIEILKGFHPVDRLFLSPSCPLSHLPVTKQSENRLKSETAIFESLSFANERLEELGLLKQLMLGSVSLDSVEKMEKEKKENLLAATKRSEAVRSQIQRMDPTSRKRTSSCTKRAKTQAKKMALPQLPVVLCQYPLGASTQKEMGVDVVCSPQWTYSDRLQDYATRWSGFMPTEEGWVQKSGRASVKPPLVVSDIEWKPSASDTSLTKECVLGPISIVNSSFVRNDLPKEQVLLQAALAVRNEIKSFEGKGVSIIQVDEPAMAEWLPVKKQKVAIVLKVILDGLKMSTSGVKDETGIHLNIDASDVEILGEVLTKCDVDVLCFSSCGNLSEKAKQLKEIKMEFSLAPGVLGQKQMASVSLKEIEQNIRKCFELVGPEKLWISVDVPKEPVSESEARAALEKLIEVTRLFRTALTRKP